MIELPHTLILFETTFGVDVWYIERDRHCFEFVC